MSSTKNQGRKSDRPSYSRGEAKKIASSKMYTASRESIRSLGAYVAAGGVPHNSAGQCIQNPVAYQNAIEASVRQNTDDPKYLYHYTNDNAARSIEENGAIQPSEGGLDGFGTYCTAKPPRCSTDTLLSNNYGSAAARDGSFVDSYVRMDADELNAQRVSTDRDVWKVNGGVQLDQHNAFVANRNNNSDRYRVQQYQGYGGDETGWDASFHPNYNDEGYMYEEEDFGRDNEY